MKAMVRMGPMKSKERFIGSPRMNIFFKNFKTLPNYESDFYLIQQQLKHYMKVQTKISAQRKPIALTKNELFIPSLE